jgi:hypothetical protein
MCDENWKRCSRLGENQYQVRSPLCPSFLRRVLSPSSTRLIALEQQLLRHHHDRFLDLRTASESHNLNMLLHHPMCPISTSNNNKPKTYNTVLLSTRRHISNIPRPHINSRLLTIRHILLNLNTNRLRRSHSTSRPPHSLSIMLQHHNLNILQQFPQHNISSQPRRFGLPAPPVQST